MIDADGLNQVFEVMPPEPEPAGPPDGGRRDGVFTEILRAANRDLEREALDWQFLAAILLAKLGGRATLTLGDDMEIRDRRPTFVRWPMRITGMEYDVELFDGDGQPWAVRDA